MSRIWQKDKRSKTLIISHVFCGNINRSSAQVSASQYLKPRIRNDISYLCEINVHYLYPMEKTKSSNFPNNTKAQLEFSRNICHTTYRDIITLQMTLEVMNIFNQCKQMTQIQFNIYDFLNQKAFIPSNTLNYLWYNLETSKPDGTFVNTLAGKCDAVIGFKMNIMDTFLLQGSTIISISPKT